MPQPWYRGGTVVRAGLAATVIALCACEAAPRAAAPARQLPSYDAHAAVLFDDGIGARSMGPEPHPIASFEEQTLLRERTRVGDRVLRVRVVSLTATSSDGGPCWVMGLRTVESVVGERPEGQDFSVQIDGRAPGAHALDGRMIGATLVVYLRQFASASARGQGEVHFHLAGDSSDEVDAVRVAALGEAPPPSTNPHVRAPSD